MAVESSYFRFLKLRPVALPEGGVGMKVLAQKNPAWKMKYEFDLSGHHYEARRTYVPAPTEEVNAFAESKWNRSAGPRASEVPSPLNHFDFAYLLERARAIEATSRRVRTTSMNIREEAGDRILLTGATEQEAFARTWRDVMTAAFAPNVLTDSASDAAAAMAGTTLPYLAWRVVEPDSPSGDAAVLPAEYVRGTVNRLHGTSDCDPSNYGKIAYADSGKLTWPSDYDGSRPDNDDGVRNSVVRLLGNAAAGLIMGKLHYYTHDGVQESIADHDATSRFMHGPYPRGPRRYDAAYRLDEYEYPGHLTFGNSFADGLVDGATDSGDGTTGNGDGTAWEQVKTRSNPVDGNSHGAGKCDSRKFSLCLFEPSGLVAVFDPEDDGPYQDEDPDEFSDGPAGVYDRTLGKYVVEAGAEEGGAKPLRHTRILLLRREDIARMYALLKLAKTAVVSGDALAAVKDTETVAKYEFGAVSATETSSEESNRAGYSVVSDIEAAPGVFAPKPSAEDFCAEGHWSESSEEERSYGGVLTQRLTRTTWSGTFVRHPRAESGIDVTVGATASAEDYDEDFEHTAKIEGDEDEDGHRTVLFTAKVSGTDSTKGSASSTSRHISRLNGQFGTTWSERPTEDDTLRPFRVCVDANGTGSAQLPPDRDQESPLFGVYGKDRRELQSVPNDAGYHTESRESEHYEFFSETDCSDPVGDRYTYAKTCVGTLVNGVVNEVCEEIVNGEPSGGEPSGGEPSGGEPSGGEPSGGEPSPSDGESSDGESSDGESSDGESSDGESSDGESSEPDYIPLLKNGIDPRLFPRRATTWNPDVYVPEDPVYLTQSRTHVRAARAVVEYAVSAKYTRRETTFTPAAVQGGADEYFSGYTDADGIGESADGGDAVAGDGNTGPEHPVYLEVDSEDLAYDYLMGGFTFTHKAMDDAFIRKIAGKLGLDLDKFFGEPETPTVEPVVATSPHYNPGETRRVVTTSARITVVMRRVHLFLEFADIP